MAEMNDDVISLIGQGAFVEIKEASEMITALGKQIKDLNTDIGNLDRKTPKGGGGGGGGNTKALGEYAKIQKDIERMTERTAVLTKELGVQYAEAKNKLAQVNKELNDNAKAQNAANNSTKTSLTLAQEQAKAIKESNKALLEEQKIWDEKNKASIRMEKANDRLVNANERERKAAEKANNQYEQMKQLHREMANEAKALGAELFGLSKQEGVSTQLLEEKNKAYHEVRIAANEYQKALSQIEQDVGEHQRNVGNYNGLLVETNHILRELPNFAISARTGILSLSNNLPLFAAQFTKIAKETDNATGKIKGYGHALKEVGKAIFSWHTLLIVGITLAVTYAKEIGLFFSNLSKGRLFVTDAQKAQLAYNDAIKAGSEEVGNAIAKIEALRYALKDTNISYEEQMEAISNAAEAFPEYLGHLNQGNISHYDTNVLLDAQILLLQKKARTEAVNAAVSASYAEKEAHYVKMITAYEEGRYIVGAYYSQKATRANEKALEAMRVLNMSEEERINLLREQIKENEKLRESKRLQGDNENLQYWWIRRAVGDMADLNLQLDNANKLIQGQIDLFDKAKNARRARDPENDRIQALENEAKAYGLVGNEMEKNRITRKQIDAEVVRDIGRLDESTKKKEGSIIFRTEKWYQDQVYGIILDGEERKKSLETKASKSRTGAKTQEVKGLLNLEQILNKNQMSIAQGQLDIWDRVLKNEEKSLTERLNAHDSFVNRQKEIERRSSNDELSEVLRRIKLAESAEKKSRNNRSDEEQQALLDMKALYIEEQRLTREHLEKMETINQNGYKGRDEIVQSYYDKLVRESQNAINQISQDEVNARNREIANLNSKYEQGNMTYKAYMRERRNIIVRSHKKENELIQKAIKDMINKSIMAMAMGDLSMDEIAKIKEFYELLKDELARSEAELVPKKRKSFIEMLFGEKGDLSEDEDWEVYMAKVVSQIKDFYNNVFNLIDDIRDRRFREQSHLLDEEALRIERNMQIEKDAIESSLMSQEEKAGKMEEIAKRKEAFDAGIEEKRKRLERQKAIADKRAAQWKIAIDGAVAIAGVIATYGFPAGLALAGIMAANTAILLASVEAQGMPVYGDGTEYHGGGLAVVGDRGTEIVKTPSGDSFLTPNKATVMDLPRGSKVIPNHELDKHHKNALNTDIVHRYQMDDRNGMEALEMMLGGKLEDLKNAVVNKREVHFNWDNGELKKSVKRGNEWTRYINNIV